MTLLELILSKIPEKASARRPKAAGKENSRLAGKKFPPLKPLHFLPARLSGSFLIFKILVRSLFIRHFFLIFSLLISDS